MRRSTRAIVFDLDDTLYPSRAFVRSGFRAVARHLAQERGFSASRVFGLLQASRSTARGQELQALCAEVGLSLSIVPMLLAIVRGHVPTLTLPRETRRMLADVRRGWRVGILTNGVPTIQQRKIQALGLAGMVDAVVLATECGDRSGKPAAAGFEFVLDRLGVGAGATVFVGDDLHTDMRGASALGMHTIHALGYLPLRSCSLPGACQAHVNRLRDVPSAADRLVSSRPPRFSEDQQPCDLR